VNLFWKLQMDLLPFKRCNACGKAIERVWIDYYYYYYYIFEIWILASWNFAGLHLISYLERSRQKSTNITKMFHPLVVYSFVAVRVRSRYFIVSFWKSREGRQIPISSKYSVAYFFFLKYKSYLVSYIKNIPNYDYFDYMKELYFFL